VWINQRVQRVAHPTFLCLIDDFYVVKVEDRLFCGVAGETDPCELVEFVVSGFQPLEFFR
jgi:hypothetical protein